MFPTDNPILPDVTIEWDKNERQRARNRINQRNYRRRKSEKAAKELDQQRQKSVSHSPGTQSLNAPEFAHDDSDRGSPLTDPSGTMSRRRDLTSEWHQLSTSRPSEPLASLLLSSGMLSAERAPTMAWDSSNTSQMNSPGRISEPSQESDEWAPPGSFEGQLDYSRLSSGLQASPWVGTNQSNLWSSGPDLLGDSNYSGKTTLHLASENGRTQSVRMLLSYGANPNLRDSAGYTPLHVATRNGHLDVVTCLIEARCDINAMTPSGRSALHLAVEANHSEITDLLLRAGSDPNIQISHQ